MSVHEIIKEHRRKIADNPWPLPDEAMSYQLPMLELKAILDHHHELEREMERLINIVKEHGYSGQAAFDLLTQ